MKTKTSPLSIRVTGEERDLLNRFAADQIIPTTESAVAHHALTLGLKILKEQLDSKPLVKFRGADKIRL